MATRSPKKTRPRYVLLIEDNVHHAELLTEVLDRHFAPIIIHTVDTIEDGLEFASQSSYDLIITGGVVNGAPIANFMPKLNRAVDGTPIVVISGRGDEKLAAEFIKKGAAEYLGKTRETLENLATLLERHFVRRRGKRTKKNAGSRERGSQVPSAAALIKEVDQLTQQALAIGDPKNRRRRRQASPDIGELDQLLSRIQKLRELASKLTPKV